MYSRQRYGIYIYSFILGEPESSQGLQCSGATKDAFLPNTFRSLEMHPKICICSVILGELESFEITSASVFCSQKFYMRFNFLRKCNFFLIPLFITFFNPKNSRFFFFEKYLSSEMWKIKLQKIVGNLLDKLRKLNMSRNML